MFILEILIYVFFAVIMFHLAQKSLLKYGEDPKLDKYLWGYIIFFSLISAFRWNVGADSVTYIYIFKNGIIREGSKEYLWDLFVNLINKLGLHFVFGMGIVAFMQIFLLVKSINRYKYILLWLPIVLFGGRYFLDLMNGVRQMVVACGFLYCSRFIIDKKLLHYIIGIFLLSLIHNSGIILLIFGILYFIPEKKYILSNHRTTCLIIFLFCFIIGQISSFTWFSKIIEPIFHESGYDHLGAYINNTIKNNELEKLSFGPIMFSFFLISLILIIYSPALYEKYESKIKYFNIWYLGSYIFSCLYFLLNGISHITVRLAQYFEFFLVIMVSLLLSFFYERRSQHQTILYGFILIIWICTIIGIYKVSWLSVDSITYKMFFGRI